jgi:hypothetical protein
MLLSSCGNMGNLVFQIWGYCSLYLHVYLFHLLITYTWYISRLFKCSPFLACFMISMVLPMFLCVYPVFNMWCEYPELGLLSCIACMCSLNLVLNAEPNWSVYFRGQYKHFNWYIPILLYLSEVFSDLVSECVLLYILSVMIFIYLCLWIICICFYFIPWICECGSLYFFFVFLLVVYFHLYFSCVCFPLCIYVMLIFCIGCSVRWFW